MKRFLSILVFTSACGSRSDIDFDIGGGQPPKKKTPEQCLVTSDAPVVLSQEDLGPLARPASVRAVA